MSDRQKAVFDSYGLHFTDGFYCEFDTCSQDGEPCQKNLRLFLRLGGALRGESFFGFNQIKGQANYALLEKFTHAATSCLNGGLPIANLQAIVDSLRDFGVARLFDDSTGSLLAHWESTNGESERFSILVPPKEDDAESVVLDWYPGRNLFDTPFSMWVALNSEDVDADGDEDGDEEGD